VKTTSIFLLTAVLRARALPSPLVRLRWAASWHKARQGRVLTASSKPRIDITIINSVGEKPRTRGVQAASCFMGTILHQLVVRSHQNPRDTATAVPVRR
jgi:hypothetical protein